MAYKDPKDPRQKVHSQNHYLKNKELYKARATERHKVNMKLLEQLKNVPCVDWLYAWEKIE